MRGASFTTAVALTLAAHHATTALDHSGRDHTPQHVATTGLLLLLSRRSGASREMLGLARAQARHGARVGGAVAAGIAGLLLGAIGSPRARVLLADGSRQRTGPIARVALIEIPAVVALEEVAFRAVLPLALPGSSRRVHSTVSTILFGLWHVLPTIERLDSVDGLPVADTTAVVSVVVVTTGAGAAFAALRARSDSVVAPLVAHGALNIGSFLAGRLVDGRTDRART